MADEWFTKLDFRWAVPAMKGPSLRWLASDYHSSERGSVAAIKEDDFANRFASTWITASNFSCRQQISA